VAKRFPYFQLLGFPIMKLLLTYVVGLVLSKDLKIMAFTER
jgi:hypothetical protein